jgi:hypothetical protein
MRLYSGTTKSLIEDTTYNRIATKLKGCLFQRVPIPAIAWTIVAPLTSLFDFDYVISNFSSLIESLFSMAIPQAAVSPPGFRFLATLPSHRSIAPSYFFWDARNIIISAMRSHTLIELTYDGILRLVEPYRIEYYVRKSDGIGSEYFWGYDTSGGKSGRIGIKQFFCNKIQFAHPAAVLRNFIGNRKSGFLFHTANGTMFDPRNIARDSLEPILEKMGRGEAGTLFNVFRRFREVVLQRSDARQILIDYWMGHSNASMGDRYGKQLVEDIEYRQAQVKKVGLGFELPPCLFGLRGLQIVENEAAA